MRTAAWYMAANVAASASSLVLVVVLSRALQPASYGVYSLILTTAGLVAMVWYGWIGNASYRYAAEYDQVGRLADLEKSAALAFVILGTVMSLLCVVGLAVAGALRGPAIMLPAGIGAVIIIASGPSGAIADIYRAVGRRQIYVAMSLCLSVIPAAAIVGAWWLGKASIDLALAAQAILPGGILILVTARWLRNSMSLGAARTALKPLAAYGLPLVAAGACSWTLSVVDRYMVAVFIGSHAVGIYTAGYQLGSAPILFAYAGLMLYAEPQLFQAKARRGLVVARAYLGECVVLLGAGAGWLALIGVVFSRPLVVFVLGPSFRSGSDVVALVALGQLCLVITMTIQMQYVLVERTRPIARNLIIAGGINVGGNCLLIPMLGIDGAAVMTLLSYGVLLVLAVCGTWGLGSLPVPPLSVMAVGIAGLGSAASAAIVWQVLGPLPAASCAAVSFGLILILAGMALTKSWPLSVWRAEFRVIPPAGA